MPGKFDSPESKETPSLTWGNAFPGSKLNRAWDEGWRARYALQAADTNPHGDDNPAAKTAWDNGWNAAEGNAGGAQRGPATTGAPGVIPP